MRLNKINVQKELHERLRIGVDTIVDLNCRGLRPTKVGREYIYLENKINKFLKKNIILKKKLIKEGLLFAKTYRR